MAAGLLFGLPAQLAGQVLEPVQGGVDAHQRELGLDHVQVEVPDIGDLGFYLMIQVNANPSQLELSRLAGTQFKRVCSGNEAAI